MESEHYKSCFIPTCDETSLKTSEKKCIRVPRGKAVEVWKEFKGLSTKKLLKGHIFCCEDHYNSIFVTCNKSLKNAETQDIVDWSLSNNPNMKNLINSKSIKIKLDTRTVNEYLKENLQGAHNINYSERKFKVNERETDSEYKTDFEHEFENPLQNSAKKITNEFDDTRIKNETEYIHFCSKDITDNGNDYEYEGRQNGDIDYEEKFFDDGSNMSYGMTTIKWENNYSSDSEFNHNSSNDDFCNTIKIEPTEEILSDLDLPIATEDSQVDSIDSKNLVFVGKNHRIPKKHTLICQIKEQCGKKLEKEIFNSQNCFKCGRVFKKISSLKNHELSCGLESYKCVFCWKRYKQISTLKSHLKKCHPNAVSSNKLDEIFNNLLEEGNESIDRINHFLLAGTKRRKPTMNFTGKYVKSYCGKCDKSSEKIFREGVARQAKLITDCLDCNTKLDYLCGMCNKLFAHFSNVRIHMRACSPQNYFKCSKCDFLTVIESNCILHEQRKHSNDGRLISKQHLNMMKLFNCQVCSYETSYKITLRVHMLTQHMGYNYKEIMWNFTKTVGEMNILNPIKDRSLIRIYISDGSFLNDSQATDIISEKTFNRYKKLLNNNVLVSKAKRNQWRSFECNECAHKTKLKYTLQLHMKRRHPEQYNMEKELLHCPGNGCFKTFTRKERYNRHIAVCLIGLQCIYCPVSYIQYGLMKNHIILKHSDVVNRLNVDNILIEIMSDTRNRKDQMRLNLSRKQSVNCKKIKITDCTNVKVENDV